MQSADRFMITNTFLFITLGTFLLTGCGENQTTHNQGRNCLECHSFTSGGTIFTTIDAANKDSSLAAEGYGVQLLLDDGTLIKYAQGNGLGNKLYKGDASTINFFTPQITDAQGNVVNQSSLNSHDAGRLACNRCHTQEGLNGAPGRIVNYDYFGNLADVLSTIR